MGTYTRFNLTNLKLDKKFKADLPNIYGWLVEKEKYQNSEKENDDFPYFHDDYETHKNELFHKVWEEFVSSHKDIEVVSRILCFGDKTSNLCEEAMISLEEDEECIHISVDYSTKYASSIGIWLKWFKPYILNTEVFGEVEYEDSDIGTRILSPDTLDKVIDRLNY